MAKKKKEAIEEVVAEEVVETEAVVAEEVVELEPVSWEYPKVYVNKNITNLRYGGYSYAFVNGESVVVDAKQEEQLKKTLDYQHWFISLKE